MNQEYESESESTGLIESGSETLTKTIRSGHVGTLFDVSGGGGVGWWGKKKITTSVFLSGQFSKNTTYRTYYTNRTDKEIKSEWYWYHISHVLNEILKHVFCFCETL